MNEQQFNLIEGDFPPEEASRILHDVYASKIQFHEKRNLSKLIKEQQEDQNSIDRIQSLKFQSEKINQIISAIPKEKQLFINCIITIKTTDINH
jgi:hypothetical protein